MGGVSVRSEASKHLMGWRRKQTLIEEALVDQEPRDAKLGPQRGLVWPLNGFIILNKCDMSTYSLWSQLQPFIVTPFPSVGILHRCSARPSCVYACDSRHRILDLRGPQRGPAHIPISPHACLTTWGSPLLGHISHRPCTYSQHSSFFNNPTRKLCFVWNQTMLQTYFH